MSEVRVRIAPSPTGYLHVGTARAALYNWLFARHHGGAFLLRIEDTDVERSNQEMVDVIFESLAWLGLKSDEEPEYQSRRLPMHRKHIERIEDNPHFYRCYCTPEELAERKKQVMDSGKWWKYDRRCLQLSDRERAHLEEEGAPYSIRFVVPEGKVRFFDVVRGEVERENTEIEDFICVRSDGRPTYNFACVIDDADMSISHVIRGEDHITNTFKQVLLYQTLDLKPPTFAHLPLLLGKDKSKLSKRHGAVSLTEYRDRGYLPEAMFNFLALLGWSPGDDREIMSRQELIELFDLDRVIKSGAVFDLEKLDWMNGRYIAAMDDEELVEKVLPFLEKEGLVERTSVDQDWLKRVLITLKERVRRLTDFADAGRFFFEDVSHYDEAAVKVHWKETGQVTERLGVLLDRLGALSPFTAPEIETELRSLAEEMKEKASALIHPTRVALTGRKEGPGLFELMELLGPEEVIKRLTKAIDYIKLRPH
jgi:nondiscriminating glutamyl-tRNA synthetase